MLGWSASALMLLAFACPRGRHLRGFAIAANLAFIAYGWLGQMHPILVLHLLLLPVNVVRFAKESRRREQSCPRAESAPVT